MPVLASPVGALPVGMLNPAVLHSARETTGSLALAGTAPGALSAGRASGRGRQSVTCRNPVGWQGLRHRACRQPGQFAYTQQGLPFTDQVI